MEENQQPVKKRQRIQFGTATKSEETQTLDSVDSEAKIHGDQSVEAVQDDQYDVFEKKQQKETVEIEDVLSFWFGGDLQQNYRKKWFPAQSSETQHVADEEIAQRFGGLLERALEGKLDHWAASSRGAAALIVLLDQYSRHIYRYQGIQGDQREAKLARTGAKALQLSEKLITSQSGRKELALPLQVFSLMPLRHMPTKERLRRVMDEIDARAEIHRKEAELLQKFRKTTLRKLQALEDRAEEGAEILEHFAFKADESDIHKNKLYKAVEKFIRVNLKKDEMGKKDCKVSSPPSVKAPVFQRPSTLSPSIGKIVEKFEAYSHSDEHDGPCSDSKIKDGYEDAKQIKPYLAVSLSGGVDSMVLAKILVNMQDRLNFQVVGVHIDYDNRIESGREADYVEHWCSTQGIIFRKRIINEVTRGITDRDAYERVAREIRYGTYKEVCSEFGCTGVLFGHHQGDVQENVLSNMMHRSSLLDLAGMGPSSNVNGVIVYRPMLDFTKEVIFDFAHKYGVPYFKDTTPSWSTRGKTRNNLIPLLQDIHGEGCLQNLSVLAEESAQLDHLVQQTAFRPFHVSVRYTPMGCFFDCMPYKDQSQFFWKEVLREVMHSMGMAQLREKGIGVLRKRLAQKEPKNGWLELRRGFPTYLEDGSLIIFKEGVLRFLEEDQPWVPDGTRIQINTETAVGPWRVKVSEVVSPSAREGNAVEDEAPSPKEEDSLKVLSKKPAFSSMKDFMSGNFTYYLCSRKVEQQNQLGFHLECMARIKPFHSVDKKLRRKLSVVNMTITDKEPEPGNKCKRVKIKEPFFSCFSVHYKFQEATA